MDSSPISTPKRKHSELYYSIDSPMINTPRFSFEANIMAGSEDGSNSPRTKVAHRFRDLALDEGGGGVAELDSQRRSGSPAKPQDDAATRKRMKLLDIDGSPSKVGPRRAGDGAPRAASQTDVVEGPKGEWATGLEAAVDPSAMRTTKANNKLQRSYPSINRLADSKSRRKRTGTPPLVPAKTKADGECGGSSTDADAPEIVEPIRASLTWHEDEITVYDPDDEDDDGTGINGIGFKPTPAIAYARTVKRKQQLAEYKKREEREARAKRSQRRRGEQGADRLEGDASTSVRKAVHFNDFESKPVVTT